MREFHLVGWLDDDLRITRLSVHDCPPHHLTRRFNVAPPVTVWVTEAGSFEEAAEYFRKNAISLLGPKLAKMLGEL